MGYLSGSINSDDRSNINNNYYFEFFLFNSSILFMRCPVEQTKEKRRRHFSDGTHAKTGENRKKNIAKCKMLHTHCFKFSKDIFLAIANDYV